MIWITAVQFDRSGGHDKHENICAFRWRAADSQHHGRYTVAELIDLIRLDALVYVSDDAFERTALVRVVDAGGERDDAQRLRTAEAKRS